MRLAEIQRRMLRAMCHRLGADWGMATRLPDGQSMAREAAAYIRPNSRLTAFERLEIYGRDYWFRILDALAEDFPGLRAIVGNRRFNEISFAFLEQCPSRSFTLRNLGSRLPRWLARHQPMIEPATRLALDMARLEWAHVVAFDGEERTPLRAQEFAALDAEARFALQPYLTLLDVRYPVDDLRLAVSELSEEAFSKARARASSVAKRAPKALWLAVHRLELNVYYRRLSREEFTVLRRLGRGETLSEAISRVLEKRSVDPDTVRGWFANWARLGWLTTHESPRLG